MTIKFEDMVKALAKPGADVIKGLTPESAHILHMAVGVNTEIGELIENYLDAGTLENCVEELGDIEFYYEGIVPHIEFSEGFDAIERDHEYVPVDNGLLRLARYGGELLDAAKKYSIYEKPLDLSKTVEALINLRVTLCNLYYAYGITREEAVKANIAKLGKRYADGNYSNKQAQDRADK